MTSKMLTKLRRTRVKNWPKKYHKLAMQVAQSPYAARIMELIHKGQKKQAKEMLINLVQRWNIPVTL